MFRTAIARVVPSFSRRSIAISAPMREGYSFELTDEQRFLDEASKKFAVNEIIPVAPHHDRTSEFPWDIVKKAQFDIALGFMNSHVGEAYGGPGLGSLTSTIIGENFSYGCSGIGTVILGNSLASAPLIVGASEEQKKKYLGRLTEAPLIASYCVTEPGAGSDVAGAKTTAVKKGTDWVINGSKMWITGAGHANWFFVMAKTDKNAKAGQAFTGFIVDANSPGIALGKKENNMGQRCSDTRGVTFEEVVVPEKNVIGEVGFGFKLAMKAFDITRPEVGSGAVGVAQRALDEAVKYALQRKTMGQAIANHGAIQTILADMAIGTEAARLLVRRAGWEMDQSRRPTFFASVAKCFAADHCVKSCVDAVQVFGGAGYNNDYPVEKLMRDSKIFQIYEGTSQIQRLIISQDLYKRASGNQ